MNIEETDFGGAKAVEITTADFKLVAVYEFGPRIAFFGKPGGENILLWKPGEYGRKDWDLRGGHRVWVTRPGADECEETYRVDDGECEVEIGEKGCVITAPEDPFNCTRKTLSINLLDGGRLEVVNSITNMGDMLYSAGVWALTCSVPSEGTRYAVPLGDGGKWDACTVVMFSQWAGHGKKSYEDDQFSFRKDLMVIDPKGIENKRMVQSERGIIAMSDPKRGLTFAKKTGFDPEGVYPNGCNIAAYIGPENFMVEMETMGAEKTLKPDQSVSNTEIWALIPEAIPLKDAKVLIDLFD